MSTYTDLHNRIKENITILRKPGSKDDGMSPQKVILINPENQFYGTFNGAINIKSGTLSDLAFVGGTIDGTKIKNATFLDGDVEVPIGEIAAAVDSHEQRITQAEADIKAISAAHDALSAGLSSAVDDLSAGIEEKIDAAVEDIDKRISGAVGGLEDLSSDVIGLSTALSDFVLNGVVYKGTLSAYHDKYDNPGQLFGDNPACCLLEGRQTPLKNGWMWRVHVDPGNVSGYVVVEDKTGKSITLGESDYIIIKSHIPSEHEVIPDANMLLDDFDVIDTQDGDDAKLSVILKLSSEVKDISAEISGLSSGIADAVSSEITAQIDQRYVKKMGDSISALTVDNDLVVDGSLHVVGDDISVSMTDDGLSVKTTEPIAIETVRKVTMSTNAPLELSASRLLANFRNTVELSVNDGLAKIYVNGKTVQSTLDDLSNALNESKFDKNFGEQVSSQMTAIQKYVDELSGVHGSEGIIKDLSDEISVLRRDEKFELQLNKVDFWTPEDADGRYSSIGHFLCALLEPTTYDVRNNTGYVVEFGASVPLSTKILISDGRGTTLGHGDTIYIHALSSIESAPIRIPFAELQPYDRADKTGNTFILQAGVSRYEFEDQSKNLDDEIANRIAADAYISAWIQQNFANTGEDNELTTTVLNQEISAKSGLSVDGAVYALNDLSAAKQLFVNNGQLAVANDSERTSVEAVADIVKINNALSASQDTVSVDFSKTVDSSLCVSITDLCVGLSTQLSDEIETRKLDDAFLSNAISTKIWIEDRANDPSDISGYSDLSVVKISKGEYEDLAIGPTRLCANVLYVVDSDYVDAYGQEIKNVLSADSETNAATVGQVSAVKAELCAYANQISADCEIVSDSLDLWVCTPATTPRGTPFSVKWTTDPTEGEGWALFTGDTKQGKVLGNESSMELSWSPGAGTSFYDVVAVHKLSYHLSGQPDKKLQPAGDYASGRQGAKADTAVQPEDLKALKFVLSSVNDYDEYYYDEYNGLSGKTISSASETRFGLVRLSDRTDWDRNAINGAFAATPLAVKTVNDKVEQKLSVDNTPANVNMVHISQEDYQQLVFDGDALSNTLYVVSGDCINAYGQTLKYLSMSDDPEESEAATQHYVDGWLSQKPDISSIDIEYRSGESERKIYLSAGGQVKAIDCNDFIKDGMLSAAQLCGTTLILTFNTDGAAKSDPISVDMSCFVDDYDGVIESLSDGISVLSGNVGTISNDVSALSDAVDSLSDAIDSKISVDGTPANVNIVHISQEDYEQLVFDGNALSNTLYVVSGDCINAYGETIQNVVMTDDPTESEAATQHYVDTVGHSISTELTRQVEDKSSVWLSSAVAGQPLSGGPLDKLNIVKFDSLDTYELCSSILTLSDLALIDEDQINAENERIISVADPVDGTDAANKRYVDGMLSSISTNSVLTSFFNSVETGGINAVTLEHTVSAVYELIKALR